MNKFNYGNEFKSYATKHRNLNTLTVEAMMKHQIKQGLPTNMTPYIIEERQMNVAQMDVFSRLMLDRIIWLGTGINDEVSNIVQAQLLFLQSVDNKRDIQLYLNSGGGSVYSGLGIYDTMRLVSPDVSTICTGLAASMAAVLLCGGASGKRFALKHSRVMLHQPSGSAGGMQSDIEITYQEITKLKIELYEIISKHSGKEYDEVYKVSDRDYWMTSEEAKDFGIVDDILTK